MYSTAGARSKRYARGAAESRMKDSPGLHLKTNILILLIVLFAPLGNVLLGKGMKRIGSAKNWVPGDIFHILLKIVTSGYIWLGRTCTSHALDGHIGYLRRRLYCRQHASANNGEDLKCSSSYSFSSLSAQVPAESCVFPKQ